MSSQEDSQPSQDSIMTVTQGDRHEIIYFAYGSSLSTTEMLQRCPNATPIGLGLLPGFAWIINSGGHANVVDAEEYLANTNNKEKDGQGKRGNKNNKNNKSFPPPPARSAEGGVYGLMYLLPPGDEEALDRHKGVPWTYVKATMDVMRVTDHEGKPLRNPEQNRVLVYVDTQRITAGLPKRDYVPRMARGISQSSEGFGLPRDYWEQMKRWLMGGTQE